jgi:methyl-accepting chemotaxis protein
MQVVVWQSWELFMNYQRPHKEVRNGNNYNEAVENVFSDRRTEFFINKSFQFKFIAQIFGFSLVITTLAYLSVTAWNFSFISTSIASLFFFTAGGVYLSQKVAGPIHKIHTVIEASANGNFTYNVKLRNGDYFSELETSVNKQILYMSELKNAKTTDKIKDTKVTEKLKLAA